MTNDITRRESAELSSDIKEITAEINAYQRIAGEAIFEIGRRLKGVRDNPEEYGFEGYRDWERWCKEEVGMSRGNANKFIQIYEELGSTSSRDIGFEKLYQIATLPPEQREAEHITAKGETKKPDEMTVRELRELKRQLKQAEQQAESERKERERLEEENEKLTNREPEVITEYIEKEPSDPYNRMLDEPYSVDRGNAFYEMMNEVDALYKKYAHLKDGVKELRGIAEYDDDLVLKYRKASDFWEMLGEIFNQNNGSIIDAEIIEIN